MPYRNVRGVNRGVQDEEELQRIRKKEKKKRRERTKRWCAMIGLTVAEFVLCLICFAFAYYYYHSLQSYKNIMRIHHHEKSVRYILLPPTPLAVASAFLTLTYVDLVSWHSLRPITYFGWIMVATSGFLLFLLYAGVIILSTNDIVSLIAILFACITALVFLADLICMLLSLKRFPVPYYVMKRKYDKTDQCVCTGDYDLEEEEVERPICRCGDHWGEPCTCDDPDLTCGCGADKKGKAPCDCCECAGIEEAESLPTIVSTMCGDDFDERTRSTITQATLPVTGTCRRANPGMYCIDGPRQIFGAVSRGTFTTPEPMSSTRVPNYSQAQFASKAMHSQRAPSTMMAASEPSRIATSSRLASPSMVRSPSRRTVNQSVMRGVGGLESPSLSQAAKIGGPHGALTETLGVPSTTMASRMAINKPHKGPHRNISQVAYSVHQITLDDKDNVRQSIASKYVGDAQKGKKQKRKKSIFYDEKGRPLQTISTISKSSSEDEIGEGDYTRKKFTSPPDKRSQEDYQMGEKMKFSTFTLTECPQHEIGYLSDPEVIQGPKRIMTLPGEVSSFEDSHNYYSSKKNVSISARERTSRRSVGILRRPCVLRSSSEDARPKSSVEVPAGPRLIRNVSTTVRAVRTLSQVMEADNESRSQSEVNKRGSDRFPSESTITLKK